VPTFEIEQLEVHVVKHRVEASTEAEAIIKLFEGQGVVVDDSLELVEICEDRGLPAEDHPMLAEALRAAGIMSDQNVIPSVRSIEEVD
jgi:hypothetical protein